MPTAVKILVADDDAVILELAERTLAGAGFEVYGAASGEQAIEFATTIAIDLAILDYRMPGLSGIDAGRSIHEITGTRFAVMSVCSDRELIERAAGEGALGFIVKPLNLAELVAQVHIGLERAAELRHLHATIENLEKNRTDAIARAIASARSVNTAVGLLMERVRQPRERVYDDLVRRARNERRKLVDVCEEIIRAREVEYRLPRER